MKIRAEKEFAGRRKTTFDVGRDEVHRVLIQESKQAGRDWSVEVFVDDKKVFDSADPAKLSTAEQPSVSVEDFLKTVPPGGKLFISGKEVQRDSSGEFDLSAMTGHLNPSSSRTVNYIKAGSKSVVVFHKMEGGKEVPMSSEEAPPEAKEVMDALLRGDSPEEIERLVKEKHPNEHVIIHNYQTPEELAALAAQIGPAEGATAAPLKFKDPVTGPQAIIPIGVKEPHVLFVRGGGKPGTAGNSLSVSLDGNEIIGPAVGPNFNRFMSALCALAVILLLAFISGARSVGPLEASVLGLAGQFGAGCGVFYLLALWDRKRYLDRL